MSYKKIAQILANYDWQRMTLEAIAAKLEEDMPEILKELSVDTGYLYAWYQKSLIGPPSPPIWTDEHIEEITNDFYLVPKQERERK